MDIRDDSGQLSTPAAAGLGAALGAAAAVGAVALGAGLAPGPVADHASAITSTTRPDAGAAASRSRTPRGRGPAVRTAATAGPADVCAGSDLPRRRGLAALASLRPSALAGYQVVFGTGRAGLLGLTTPALRRVDVYVRPCDAESRPLLRHVIAHELGHAWDRARLTAPLRAAWRQARGIPASTPWLGCSRCADFATPAGDFAEVYAQWRTGSASNFSQLAPSPGPAALRALAQRFFGA